ncbi:hypothetical protein AC1031_001406 [Aphanomyces cochlioides]|nr:hypothetical protein AC1031_001406 [Aphanomyces cochlioides]
MQSRLRVTPSAQICAVVTRYFSSAMGMSDYNGEETKGPNLADHVTEQVRMIEQRLRRTKRAKRQVHETSIHRRAECPPRPSIPEEIAVITFFAAASLLPTITWIIGSIPYLDYKKQLQPDVVFIDGFSGFIRAFPCATWLFVGLEALNTVGDEIKDPRIIVPKGQRFAIATVFCTGITSIIISGGLPPGIRAWPDVMNTWNSGFSLIFQTTEVYAAYPSVLGPIGTLHLCLQQAPHVRWELQPGLQAFSNALLQERDAGNLSRHGRRRRLTSLLSCKTLDNIGMLSAAFAYSTQCYGYIFLKKYFHHLERKFHSPLGVYGAYFSMSVWVVQIISIAFFQDDNFAAGGIFLAMLVMLLIYYHRIAKHNQMFSEEEEKILFSTHVSLIPSHPSELLTSCIF